VASDAADTAPTPPRRQRRRWQRARVQAQGGRTCRQSHRWRAC
jgi:hypothetical protein